MYLNSSKSQIVLNIENFVDYSFDRNCFQWYSDLCFVICMYLSKALCVIALANSLPAHHVQAGNAPAYLADDRHQVTCCQTRLATTALLNVPWMSTSFWDTPFGVAKLNFRQVLGTTWLPLDASRRVNHDGTSVTSQHTSHQSGRMEKKEYHTGPLQKLHQCHSQVPTTCYHAYKLVI